jgi:hypothetical protein
MLEYPRTGVHAGEARGSIMSSEPTPIHDRLEAERRRVLAELVPTAAHELNNVLAILGGSAELFAMRLELASSPEVDAARTAQARGIALLAALARVAKSAHDSGPEPVELAALVGEVGHVVEPFGRKSGVRVDVRTGAGAVVVTAEPEALRHALVCITVLAVEASIDTTVDEGPALALRLARDARRGGVELEFTGEPTATATESARERAIALGATFESRRSDSGDMVWTVTLARVRDTTGGSGETGDAPATAAQRARVLVVEPDQMLADLIAAVLAEAGHAVHRVPDPAAGEAALASERFDAVLVDVAGGGQALLARLENGLPVGVLGGAGEHAGAHPSIDKPFRPGELLDLVAGLLA